jgi:hypothetical protein
MYCGLTKKTPVMPKPTTPMSKVELLKKIRENHEAKGCFISIIESRVAKGIETDSKKRKLAKMLNDAIPRIKKYDETIYKELEKIIAECCVTVDLRKSIKDKVRQGKQVSTEEWEKLLEKL